MTDYDLTYQSELSGENAEEDEVPSPLLPGRDQSFRSRPAGSIKSARSMEKKRDVEERRIRFMAAFSPIAPEFERFCIALERDRERGNDLYGESILRAWENFDQINDPKALLSWLFTTASRLAARRGKRERLFLSPEERSILMDEDLPSSAPLPDHHIDTRLLYSALALLPLKMREAVILFEIQGLNLNEVREIQGGSVTALKVRLHRGRKRLAEIMGVEKQEEVPGRRDGEESRRWRRKT